MNPTKGVPPIITRNQDPGRSASLCGWFLNCRVEAYADVEHPTLGSVPVCEDHLRWLQEDE